MPLSRIPVCARILTGTTLMAVLFTLVGCGDGGPKIVPVSGVVTIDGHPLAYGHIQVIPSGWRPASGRLDSYGRFTLTTTIEGDGCAVGTHPVAILAGESTTPDTMKWHAPSKYADVKTSDLTMTVTGPTDSIKIELKSDGSMKPGKVVREGGSEFSK